MDSSWIIGDFTLELARTPLGSLLDPFWITLGSPWNLIGPILGPTWIQFGSLLVPSWNHLGSILGPPWIQLESYCLRLPGVSLRRPAAILNQVHPSATASVPARRVASKGFLVVDSCCSERASFWLWLVLISGDTGVHHEITIEVIMCA